MATIERATPWKGYWFTPAAGPRPGPPDVLLAAAVAFVQIGGTAAYRDDVPVRWDADAFAYLLLSIGPLALLVRRRWPEAVLAVTFAAAAPGEGAGAPGVPAGRVSWR